MEDNIPKYSIVMVAHISDLGLARQNIPVVYHFLKPKQIIVITNKNAECKIKQMDLEYVKFMDEDKVLSSLSYKKVENMLRERCPSSKRTGWYFQQFIKMAYAASCEDEWYLLWDADTIPLKNINFFTRGQKGILDIKSEYNKPYFRTIKKLIGLDKQIDGSFISEHMLINKNVMLKLIKQIESNTDVEGIEFFEKIINAVNTKDLKGSGFSEYETYGNFVMHDYQGMYTIRKLRTLREAKMLMRDCVDEKLLKWAGKSYDIISFEKYHKTDPIFGKLTNSFLRYFISMRGMWFIYKKIHMGNYYE